jgi:tetratricopeptide (TPR) repeat protein
MLLASSVPEKGARYLVLRKRNRVTNSAFFRAGVTVLLLVTHGVFFCPISEGANEIDEGLKAARAGQIERAIQLWTKAIQRNPRSYVAHVNRGSAYLRTGYVWKGISDWHRARELSPPFVYALYTGDFVTQAAADSSLLNYAVSLELEPDHVASVIMMGTAYQDLGRKERATELYRKSVDLTRNPLLKSSLDHWATTLEASPSQ